MDNRTDLMVLCTMYAVRFVQIGCALFLTKPTFCYVFIPGSYTSAGFAKHAHCFVSQGVSKPEKNLFQLALSAYLSHNWIKAIIVFFTDQTIKIKQKNKLNNKNRFKPRQQQMQSCWQFILVYI